jgi:peptidoglycan LD-endopeptidase LytH
LSTYIGLEDYVRSIVTKNNAQVAYGGYGEHRSIYGASEHFRNPETDRCIHLGIDLWASVGTKIFAPLNGKVHSFKYNDQHLDYGATIILEHSFMGEDFYLLYGHLSVQSLADKQIGQYLHQGQAFATIGNRSENGGWVPHLHLQKILDIGDWKGDFPGVATKIEAEKYLSNSPNPIQYCIDYK